MNIEKLAREHNVEYIDRGNGHIQLRGALLVNYYPNSRTKSAYVAGTKKAHKYVDAMDAIKMCYSVPVAVGANKDKRSGESRKKREKMLKKGMKTCCWCGCALNIDNSTIEHVIPLDCGGLDNANNRKLACEPCNSDRGNTMPEIALIKLNNKR